LPLLVGAAAVLVGALVLVAGWRLVDGYRSGTQAPPRFVAAPVPPSSASPAGPRTLTVLAAGDVLVHPEVWQQAAADARAAGGTGYDFFPMFERVSPAISGADLAICHMEVVVGSGEPSGFPYFKAPPQVVDGVKKAGFDACSTVSNHTLDQGVAGVSSTIDAFEAAGLGHTGSYRSAQEAGTPTIYEVKGVRVGHLAYSLHFNGLKRPAGRLWMANLIEPTKIIAAAGKLRAAGAEIIVLSLHWGTEYRHAPDANQLAWARELIASPDIDLVIGHHAHVVQPFEKFGEKWVVYGMGNELARHAEPINDNREGVMARITFTEVGPARWRITAAEAIPTWVEISPKIRLVDLPRALADPATPANLRATYQAAYNRIKKYLLSRGAGPAGLSVVAPAAG
jgi:poly-gamma-glutamate synthesis protein (capsule biosynthesis protein)